MKFSSTVWPSKCARYTWSADIDGLGEGGSVGGGRQHYRRHLRSLLQSIRASVVAARALSLSAPIVAGSQRLGSACCSVSLSSPLTGRFTPVVVVSGSGSVIAPSQHPLRSTDFSSFHVVRGAIHAALVCRAPSKSRARMLAMPAAMSLTHRRDDADRASVAHKKA